MRSPHRLALYVPLVAVLATAAYWAFRDARPAALAVEPAAPVNASATDTRTIPVSDRGDAFRQSGLERETHSEPVAEDMRDHSASFKVLVLNTLGQPLEGADVMLVANGGIRRLGDTDSVGTLDVVDGPSSGALIARRNGWSAESVPIVQPMPNVVQIVLFEEGTIKGQVVYSEGRPVPAGYLVVAWESAYRFPDASMVRNLLLGNPTLPMVETQADGRFVLRSLSPRKLYSVAAGGRGYAAAKSLVLLQPGGQPVTITVARAYAVAIRCVESDGTPLLASPAYDAGVSMFLKLAQTDPEVSLLSPWMLPLAGVPWEELERDWAAYSSLVAYVAGDDRDYVGPLRFSGSVPGHVSVEADVFASPVGASLPEEEIRFQSISSGFGSLEVRLIGGGFTDRWYDSRSRPVAHIELIPSRGQTLTFAVRDISSGSLVLDNIPYGQYQVRMRSLMSSFVAPGAPDVIDIRAEGAVVEINKEALGALHIHLQDDQGRGYYGAAVAIVMEEDAIGGRWTEVDFRHAPYDIAALAEGVYSVACRYPKARAEQTSRVSIAPSEVADVTLVLLE
jgi:hypothetical protein